MRPMATLDRSRATALVEPHWRQLYNFVFRLTLDRDRAERYLADVFALAAEQISEMPATSRPRSNVWLLGLANQLLEERLPRQPEVNFDIARRHAPQRSDAHRRRPLAQDPQRDFLLWELKQGCMTAVVNCLPPGERAAFVVCHVLKLADDARREERSAITESAYKVRLSRARKKIGDYLAPRCEHVNPMNPCRCPARVGTALHKGFIRPIGPVGGEVSLRKPADRTVATAPARQRRRADARHRRDLRRTPRARHAGRLRAAARRETDELAAMSALSSLFDIDWRRSRDGRSSASS